MSHVVQQLAETLQSLDEVKAKALEYLVLEAMAKVRRGANFTTWPSGYFSRGFIDLASREFEDDTKAQCDDSPETALQRLEAAVAEVKRNAAANLESLQSEVPPQWPPGYFAATAGALDGEEFERPPQGEHSVRDEW